MCYCFMMSSLFMILIFILQEEQLQSGEREKNRELADAQQKLRQKVVDTMTVGVNNNNNTTGSRADKGGGDYQERAAADSGDETES